MSGLFIALEGIDTKVLFDQTEYLAEWLRTEEKIESVIVTREPTDGPLGAQLHSISNERLFLHAYPLAVLQNADRIDHLFREGGILDCLDKGSWVLSAKYLLSSFVHSDEHLSLEWLIQVNQLCRWPDLTIFFDIPVDNLLIKLVYEQGYKSEEVDKKRFLYEEMRHNYLKTIDFFIKQKKNIEIVSGENIEIIRANCIEIFQNKLIKGIIE